ncbi:hypothetical protein CVO77_14800 [Sphingopyxis lindanitolerans]|uniref:2Fe-2S ferredoxin-type domain-containing protein n=1 Tax=Sphingopyxis lindanitolerans TaxID=2054227 RepID=A0A2S8B1X0_9SPHN|nr:2Fe-2S iron-sulfur cluster-binding protein [Sphingopyxis lindanitolerans]PQM26326.1 hypothetical protein CVO77_14800 [Sphingopyxis lindanitolerans]
MTRVLFVAPDGSEREAMAEDGHSLMETALRHGIDAISADCGGGCSCATCHVLVDPVWVDRLAPMNETESLMLEFVEDRQDNSRLSCQIELHPLLEGLRVILPSGGG